MLKLYVIALFAVMAYIAYERPLAGIAFMWVAIWLYPVKGMYGTLWLDIRLSDLWVVYVTFLAMLKGRTSWSRTLVVRLSLFWFLAILAGDLSGWWLRGGGNMRPYLKDAFKALYVPCSTLAVGAFLRSERDVRNLLGWLTAAIMAAGLLGILMVHYPARFETFTIPKEKLAWRPEIVAAADLLRRRARGTMGSPSLAQVSLVGILLSVCMATVRIRRNARIFYACSGLFCLVSLVYTVSRGCITALLCTLLWAFLVFRRRERVLALTAVGICLIVFNVALLQRLVIRFSGEEGGLTAFMQGLQARLTIARGFLRYPQPAYLFLGVGRIGHKMGTTHNAYIGSFVYSGSPGIVLLGVLMVYAWRQATRLLRLVADPLSRALGHFLQMTVLSFGVYAFGAENFQSNIPMQLYFAGLAIVSDRLHAIQALRMLQRRRQKTPFVEPAPTAQEEPRTENPS